MALAERIPANFARIDIEGIPFIRKQDGKEESTLTDRPFSHIDEFLNFYPSKIIERLIFLHPDRPIHILDLGGGSLSRAANDLVTQYDTKVKVVNADISVSPQRGSQVLVVQTDATSLPLRDGSFDMIYSYQMLPYLDPRSNYVKEIKVLRECSRLLKDGGYALFDEIHFSRVKKNSSELKVLAHGLDVNVTFLDRGKTMSRFSSWFYRISTKFMVLEK